MVLAMGAGLRAASSSITLPEDLFPELKRLIESSLTQSPRMLIRAASEEVAAGDALVARSAMLPNANAFGQFNEQLETRVDVPGTQISEKTYYNAGVTQPVFHWGALRNAARVGKLRQVIESGQTAEAYRLLVNEIRAQFLQLVIKRQTLERARFGLNLAKENVRLGEEKYANNAISSSELSSMRTSANLAELATDRAEEDYRWAKNTLIRLAGVGSIDDARVGPLIPPVTPAPEVVVTSEAEYLAQSEPASYVLRNYQRQARIEGLNYDIQRVRLRPKLNAVVGASQDQVSYTANIGQRYGVQTYFAGLQVNWSIFDGFATRGLMASARARKRIYERNYDELSDQLKAQVQHAAREISFSARAMAFSDVGVPSSESSLQLTKERFERGEVAEIDVKTAEAAVLDAQIAASSARYDYLMRTAEFLSLTQKDPALDRLPEPRP